MRSTLGCPPHNPPTTQIRIGNDGVWLSQLPFKFVECLLDRRVDLDFSLCLQFHESFLRKLEDGGRETKCDVPFPARRYYNVVVGAPNWLWRSEEHTSELQSRQYLVCRLL